MSAKSITLIQGLRAAAALSVTLHHVLNDGLALGGPAPSSRFPGLSWDAGIDVFFVISGFVMVYASETLFAAPGCARRFLIRRAVRVAPLYWMTTAAFAAAALLVGGVHATLGGPVYAAASLLFIPWPRPDGVLRPMYEVGWTLNYEMEFYAVFALCIALPRRAATAAVAALLIAAVWASPERPTLAYWADPIVLEFVLGMAVATALREGARPPFAARGALLALAGAAMLALGLGAPALPRVLRFGVPAALLVAAAALGPEPRLPPRARVAMLALGDASYALYLAHPFMMRALQMLALRLHADGRAAFWAYVAVAVAGSVAASLAVHAWVEAPTTRALRRRFAHI